MPSPPLPEEIEKALRPIEEIYATSACPCGFCQEPLDDLRRAIAAALLRAELGGRQWSAEELVFAYRNLDRKDFDSQMVVWERRIKGWRMEIAALEAGGD